MVYFFRLPRLIYTISIDIRLFKSIIGIFTGPFFCFGIELFSVSLVKLGDLRDQRTIGQRVGDNRGDRK